MSLNDMRKGKVGLIGIGTMGQMVASKFLENDYDVVGYDLLPDVRRKAHEMGVEIVDSVGDVAKIAQVMVLSLPGPAQVKEVVSGKKGLLSAARKGQIIVDLSTVDPFSTRTNAKEAKKFGIGYLDAPVLGRPQKCGSWTLPIGGEKEDLEKARKVLEVLAAKIIHVGPSGWGNVVKVLNNMMFAAINSITAEIFALCAKLGMNPKILYEAIASSEAASVSNLFKELGPKILNRDFEPLFAIDLLHKDVSLGIQMANKVGVPLFVSHANQLLNEIARLKGLGKEDTASVIKVYEDFLSIEVKG